MNAQIISVGSELLCGKQCNTNAQYIAQQLKNIGVDVRAQVTVGDSENDIKKATSDALEHSNIVILTGGLGPTPDDITKEAVCSLLNIKLKVDEASLERIEKFFARKGEKMAENNIRQAQLPEGAAAIKNEIGLAPGSILKSGNQCIIMLPGVPSEMKTMFENGVKPFLKSMTGYSAVSKTVNVFSMSESLIAEALSDIMQKKSPTVATYAGGDKTDILVSAKADDIKEAIYEVDSTVEEIERRLGDVVYGIDSPSLQHTVVSQLVTKKLTVATAESCTGGLLSKKITDIAGSSICFGFGVTSYSESAKNGALGVHKETLQEFGAVSAETACQMAVGAMTRANSDLGVAITGYAGPSNSLVEPLGLVFIAVCNKDTVWVKRFELANREKETREYIREMASLHALDMIRRVVNALPIFNSQRLPVSEVPNSIQSNKPASQNVMFRGKSNNQTNEESENINQEVKAFDVSAQSKFMKFVWTLLPNKLDETSEKVRKSVFLTALVALIVSVCYICGFFFSIAQNKNLYTNLEELKTQKPTTSISYPEGYLEEFGVLYQENPDVAGWIEIEGTVLNYPVVQGADNDYYLTHNFYGKKERHGVPFMDYRNNLKELDTNTILHGHNMKSDNQMFSELENYYKGNKALSYYRQHPLITFDTVYERSQWKIFAVFTCNVNTKNGEVFPFYDFLVPQDGDEFTKFVDDVRTMSKFNIPVDVEYGDRLLTLSTCYYDYDGQRLVVMARKVRDGESKTVDVNRAQYNTGENKYVPSEKDDNSSHIFNNIINNNSNFRPQNSSSSKKPTSSIDDSYWTTEDSSSSGIQNPEEDVEDVSTSSNSSNVSTSSDTSTSSDVSTSSETSTSSDTSTSSSASQEPTGSGIAVAE